MMKRITWRGYCTISVLLCCSFFLTEGKLFAQNVHFVSDGVCDARKVDLSSSRIQLSGRWKFFPNKLVAPQDIAKEGSHSMMVPCLWNELSDSATTINFGTYALDVLIPKEYELLALEIPQLYNSYFLFIDDSLVASNGVPGSTKKETLPQWRPQSVGFRAKSDTVRIVLQVSNFYHYKGGIREPIFIGAADNVRSHFNGSFISTVAEVILLILLALLFAGIWKFKNKNRISIYFAMFCIAWATRELFSDIYPVSNIFPDINWFFLVRMEYISLFLIIIFSILFLTRLFADVSSQLFKVLIIAINLIFIGFTLLSPIHIFTRWLPLYLMIAAVTLVYAAIVIIRALILDKIGAGSLILGLALMIMTMGYDLVAYKGMLVNYLMVGNIGYCLILCCCAVGLLQYLDILWSPTNSDNRLTYRDLYR